MSKLNRLPDFILSEIFEYLEDEEMHMTLLLVCKHWNHLKMRSLIRNEYENINIKNYMRYAGYVRSIMLDFINIIEDSMFFPNLVQITLDTDYYFNNMILVNNFIRNHLSLRKAIIYRTGPFSDSNSYKEKVYQFLNEVPCLYRLNSLEIIQVFDRDSALEFFSKAKTLSIKNMTLDILGNTYNFLELISIYFPSLETLTLLGTNYIAMSLQSVQTKTFTNLKSLSLYINDSTSTISIPQLSPQSFPRLKSICTYIHWKESSISQLESSLPNQWPNIKSITLKCPNESDLDRLVKMVQLKTLNLTIDLSTNWNLLKETFISLKLLTNFQVTVNFKMDSDLFRKFLFSLKSLTVLSLKGNVTDQMVLGPFDFKLKKLLLISRLNEDSTPNADKLILFQSPFVEHLALGNCLKKLSSYDLTQTNLPCLFKLSIYLDSVDLRKLFDLFNNIPTLSLILYSFDEYEEFKTLTPDFDFRRDLILKLDNIYFKDVRSTIYGNIGRFKEFD